MVKLITISTTISFEDYDFVKKNGHKISHILKNAILDLKQQTGQEILGTFKEEKRRKEAFQKLCKEMRDFIEKKGLLNEWLNGEENVF